MPWATAAYFSPSTACNFFAAVELMLLSYMVVVMLERKSKEKRSPSLNHRATDGRKRHKKLMLGGRKKLIRLTTQLLSLLACCNPGTPFLFFFSNVPGWTGKQIKRKEEHGLTAFGGNGCLYFSYLMTVTCREGKEFVSLVFSSPFGGFNFWIFFLYFSKRLLTNY